MKLSISTVQPGAVALMALMTATRFHHFGTAYALPDASLAIFFLAGLWLGGRYLFALLLLLAGLIDYLAISQFGVSDFCVSAAYVFLVPAYAAMWFAGLWCRRFNGLSTSSLVQRVAALGLSTSLAFLLSNGSFYWLSGRFAETSWSGYIDHAADYFLSYLGQNLIWGVTLFALVTAGLWLLALRTGRQAA
ncbi:MAG: hypothetical protein KGZ80_03925 [Methylomonas sp.]|nr:hypothetical protein [Methylomonas sp.]PPD21811.1 MAG: hypothetical protein CTY23_04320 [Methylomonas sp.]PPD27496.1 MAG: hypothetical protein CTY22_01900 [Methylomonas sp.]PPD39479.1 MAG: hypothetical protein CTY21_01895 [Methylomonas sp.]PPD42279.1 MAG: hypothetical protein CTY17_01780 [Methylomonas sp.]